MERYRNLRGNSPVLNFLIEEDRISVWFKGNPKKYIYPEYLTGKHHFIQLKSRTLEGSGLSAYITKNVKNKFIK